MIKWEHFYDRITYYHLWNQKLDSSQIGLLLQKERIV